jgi:hypothetical protein
MAACSAALSAAGKGSEEPPLDEPAKARWRRQALDWLRADLAYGTKIAQIDLPVVKEVVILRLRRWKVEPDLACVRDDDALDKLPEADQKAWRDFWAEVEALIGAP